MKVNIRSASTRDADILAGLVQDVQRLHADAMPHIFKQPQNAALFAADFRERILSDANTHVFIAEVVDDPAGYVVAVIIQHSETPYAYALQTIHIDQISVKPAYRHGGCGRALIQTVFDLAHTEGIERITLDTWAFNREAHMFFQRMGFEFSLHRMDTFVPFQQVKSR